MSLASRTQEHWRVNKYLWICLCYVGIWLDIQRAHYSVPMQRHIAWIFAAGLVSMGVRSTIAYCSGRGTSGQWGWFFTTIDISLIAAAVRLTGKLNSELWLLYFLVVITETLSVSIKAETLLFLLVLGGYTAALWPLSDGVAFITRLFFLYVVGSVARRLYHNAEERNRQVVRLREQLAVAGEQNRLARELHDGLGREMVNVILGLEVARRAAVKQPDQVPDMLEQNIALLRTAMDETRDLIFQIQPWAKEGNSNAGLCERISRYASLVAERSGLTIHCRCDLEDQNLLPEITFGVLRMVQEALNNAVKHAHATEARITLFREEKRLIVTVQDNGAGFIEETQNAGIGLRALRERAAELGGSAEITSAPGQGTTVRCCIAEDAEANS